MKIFRWNDLPSSEQQNLLLRPELINNRGVESKTKEIIDQVRRDGDRALFQLTEKFDKAILKNLEVSVEEIKNGFNQIEKDALTAIQFAKNQLEHNHQTQYPKNHLIKTCEGVYCERQARPIEKIGLYIPGGSAPLVSTVLMLGVPAQIAQCPTKILCTPANEKGEINPHILVAAQLCGIESIFKIGGAQAIAAMAYGTETIPKVNKIFGPGNNWVTQAKLLISDDPNGASIDMPAGPSELMVIADNNANPQYVAADLLSQAEHGVDSQVMLVVLSETFATLVAKELNEQVIKLTRNHIIKQSLLQSRILIVDNIWQAFEICNCYAPEHLILQIQYPERYMEMIKNAGAVFLGQWAPETVGDYVTGSNHVLPTHGYAKSYSGLSVIDFMKFISFQAVSKQGLKKIGSYAEQFAKIEGLEAHKNAVTLRLSEICNEQIK